MKKPAGHFLCTLLAVFLVSCASRPVTIANDIYIPPIVPEIHPEFMTAPVLSIEQVIEIIRKNEANIDKYFIFDENRQITVKANITDGTRNFEVTYDLNNAVKLQNSSYEVRFIIREKGTGLTLEDTLIWIPRTGNAGLLLSFDDDYMDTWEQYLDFFDDYGAKVTFFIIGEYNPFCTIALNRGHDIGFHTLSHLDLRQLSGTDFYLETIESVQSFRQEGIPVSSLAFPYGFSEAWMYDVLLEYYSVLRGYGTTFRLYDKDNIGSSHIISRAIDNTVLQGEDNFDHTIRLMLMTVKFMDKNWVLPLTSHDISNAAWAIRHRRLEFLLGTAVDLGLKFYLFSDFKAAQ
ncbi:MAG: polysaccharide deacetylase family protein [Treponema sp.]|nr:polysaccharide deacetylase family protein [Treponema sp.]